MLRNTKRISHEPTTKRTRFLVVGLLAASAIFVAAWRVPKTNSALAAEPRKPVQGSAKPGKLDLNFIPEDCPMFFVVRPADVLGRPEFAGVLKRVKGLIEESPNMAMLPPLEQVEQVTVAWSSSEIAPKGPGPKIGMAALIVLKTNRPYDWRSFAIKQLRNPDDFGHAGKTYYLDAHPNDFSYAFGILDDRTLVIAKESRVKNILAGIETPKSEHAWDAAWKALPNGTGGFALDVKWLAEAAGPALNQPNGPQAMFAPLWKDAKALALTIDESKGLSIHAFANCNNDDGGKRVAETLESVLVLAKNGVEQLKDQIANMPKNAPDRMPLNFQVMITKGIEPLLASAKVKQDGKIVRLDGATEFNLAATIETMLPAITAARSAARRAQSTNNMKQIGLAFHNFHSANDHFPGNIRSKAGKPLLSWRVAILPYLEQNALYEQFHQDEPWDSDHNKKLIDMMPSTYVVPGAKVKPGKTSYFALNGPDTIVTKDGEGTQINQIVDGTSNTIVVVEAKRDIPWTKPDDIPFDASKDEKLPQVGGYFEGGFSVLIADGSVRFIKETIDIMTFKALTTKAGGEIIQADEF